MSINALCKDIDMGQMKINNHYIPQMYLRNWSPDGKKVWVYRKLVSHENVPSWEKKSIENIGSLPRAYSHIRNNEETDAFENWLNQEVETPAKPVFEKVLSGEIVSDYERVVLLKFAVVQMTRTFAYYVENYETMLNAANKVLNQWEQGEGVFEKPYTPKIRQSKLSQLPTDEYMPVNCTITNDNENAYVKMEVAVGRSTWLSHIKRMAEDNLHHFEKCDWHIIEAAEGIEWPTSDNPVVSLSKNGILVEGNEIIFPLSPKHLLYTRIGSKHSASEANNLQRNSYFSGLVRCEVLRNGFLYIYSRSSKKQHMFRDCPRTVDEIEFKRINKEFEEWHKINSEIEAKYFADVEDVGG
jgi:hypothetical protein